MWLRRIGIGLCCGAMSVACGGTDDNPAQPGASGSTAQAGSGGSGGGGSGAGAANGGSSAGQGTVNAGNSSGGAALPDGGKEYRGIVNLVSADAAKEFDDYFAGVDPYLGGMGEKNLELATRLFYSHYQDEYDFLFILNDHGIDSPAEGLHSWVSKPPQPGTGADEPVCSGTGPGHLLSVVGIQVPRLDSFPPFAHEFAHHFAVNLADELGFSRDVDTEFRGHWGMTSTNGQLGGFDPASLECETPAGAKPPNCTPATGGRFRYKVAPFRPNADPGRTAPFGPIELYMMGLLPKEEVPSPLLAFDGADFKFENQETSPDGKLIIDAKGIKEIPMQSIVARHGEVPPLPEGKRQFKAAVVLVTAAPAAQTYLDHVADWAAIFSGEMASTQWSSFKTITGGRATMSMKLGARHDLGPDDVLEFTCPFYDNCSPLEQDCSQGRACYGTSSLYCATPGTLESGTTCKHDSECKPGLVCAPSPTSIESGMCSPYCDHVNADASNACAKLCPNGFSPIYNTETLAELGAFCFGGSGGTCDPLKQDCGAGKACTGVDVASCEIAGNIKLGQVCPPLGGACEVGGVCVGVQGEPDLHCQAYCDPTLESPAPGACDSKCAKGAWQFTGYGICMP